MFDNCAWKVEVRDVKTCDDRMVSALASQRSFKPLSLFGVFQLATHATTDFGMLSKHHLWKYHGCRSTIFPFLGLRSTSSSRVSASQSIAEIPSCHRRPMIQCRRSDSQRRGCDLAEGELVVDRACGNRAEYAISVYSYY